MFRLFHSYHDIVAVLSERDNGNMKLGDSNLAGVSNRAHFLGTLGIDPEAWVRCENIHGNKVAVVGPDQRGKLIKDTDGLVTVTPGLFLMLAVADCLPLYFFDKEQNIIGLAHAGWRGVRADIAGAMLDKFVRIFHSNPAHILVGVGPGIGECHFEVKPEVAEEFSSYPDQVYHTTDGTFFIDLKAIIRQQLQRRGVWPEHIEISPHCTYDESDKYFSRRRDYPKLEAMIAVMGLRE